MLRAGSQATEDYRPGKRFVALYYTIMALSVLAGFAAVFVFELTWEDTNAGGWPWIAGLLIGVLAGPYLLQYAVLRALGTRPSRLAWGGSTTYLVSWWRTEGLRLTRAQFAMVYGLPALFMYALMGIWLFKFPSAAPALGFAVPAYGANLWYSLLVLKRPEGTTVEKRDKGIRFYGPAV